MSNIIQQALQNPAMAKALEAMVAQMLQGGAVPLILSGASGTPQVGRVTQMFRDPKNGALYPRNDEFELTEGLEPVLVTCLEGGKLDVKKAGEVLRKDGDGMILMTQAVVGEDGQETGEVVTAATGLTGGFEDGKAVNSPLRKRIAKKAAAAKGDELAADGVLGDA